MTTATSDLSDAHPHLPTADPVLRDFGGRPSFHGPIETVKTIDDNMLVRATLETPGEGRVLVVDNRASMRTAMIGDILAGIGIENEWAGIVVNGCLRDSVEIGRLAIGVKAIATVPRRSSKNGIGEVGVDVAFAGVTFIPGQWLYADRDGILVSPEKRPSRDGVPRTASVR